MKLFSKKKWTPLQRERAHGKHFVTPVFFKLLTSAAGEMNAVNILDFLNALFICKSTISSIIGHMLLFDIFTHPFSDLP